MGEGMIGRDDKDQFLFQEGNDHQSLIAMEFSNESQVTLKCQNISHHLVGVGKVHLDLYIGVLFAEHLEYLWQIV